MIISYVVSLCLSEELEQVSPRHELHDNIHRVIVQTHTQYLHDIRVVEVTTRTREVCVS